MSNIHFSKESFKKLSNSKLNKNQAMLLNKFDPMRIDDLKMNEQQRSTFPSSTVKKISDEEWERIKENANRVGNKLTYKELMERKRRNDELVKTYGVSESKKTGSNKKQGWMSVPSKPYHKKQKAIVIKRKNSLRKTDDKKPLYDGRGKDYYDYAGEYEARSISFGYGRKKSKEYRGPILHGRGIYKRSKKSKAHKNKAYKNLQKMISRIGSGSNK